LALRRKDIPGEIKPETTSIGQAEESTKDFVKVDGPALGAADISDEQEAPDRKKPRSLSLEEYEAALDQDATFSDIDLDFTYS